MDWAQLVKDVIEEARRNAGSGPALARLLEQAGVGPDGGFSESGISNWTKGRTKPPPDVLLAAAWATGISLDRKVSQLAEGVDDNAGSDMQAAALRRELDDLRKGLARMDALLMDLYSRTGLEYPHERPADGDRQRRRMGA